MKIFIATLAILIVGVYGRQRCYPINFGKAVTEAPASETTRLPDCIDELKTLDDPRLQPFIDAVVANEDQLRNDPDWCEVQAQLIELIGADPVPSQTPDPVRRKRQTSGLESCLNYYENAQSYIVDATSQNANSASALNNVDQLVQEKLNGLSGDVWSSIYDTLKAAVRRIKDEDNKNFNNYVCSSAQSARPELIEVDACVECIKYAIENPEEVDPYLNPAPIDLKKPPSFTGTAAPITEEPEEEEPVEENPEEENPEEQEPVEEEPVEEEPEEEEPAEEEPVEEEPEEEEPEEEEPAEEEPVEEEPAEEEPAEEEPVEEEPAEEEPEEEKPEEEEPVEEEPEEEEPAEEEPVEEDPAGEKPVSSSGTAAPLEENPVEEAPIEPEVIVPEPIVAEPPVE